MQINAIKKGTVIDHLPSSKTVKLMEVLGFDQSPETVTVAFNLKSSKDQKKGLIKISRALTREEEEKIALIAGEATINVIENYRVQEKFSPKLPSLISHIARCVNPRCISNIETISGKFLKESDDTVRCVYCERLIRRHDIIVPHSDPF